MNEKYERMKRIVLNSLPEIPKVITQEWIEEALKSEYFWIWGFTFCDLSNNIFDENIDPDILRRVSFSSQTIFPKNSPIKFDDKMIGDSDEFKKIHDEGINGEGINLAVIDYGFITRHDELKDKIVNEVTCEGECHFHGNVVTSILAGKNIGVCPKSKVYFFESPYDTQTESVIALLKKIYELNQNGANIRIVNISASKHRESNEFDGLVEKLKEQGCYVIDSGTFAKKFIFVNKDFYTGEIYPNIGWEEYSKKYIGVYNNTRVIPLHETDSDYAYVGQASASWTIPIISGLFALCLQINSDLTFDEFLNLVLETKVKTDNGLEVISPLGIINDVKLKYSKTK